GVDGKATDIAVIEQGNQLHIRGAGDVLIRATQQGDLEFAPATTVARSLRILRAPLDVFVTDMTRAYGEPNPIFEVSYRGFVNGDGALSLDVPPQAATAATPTSPPGTYRIAATGAMSSNY